MFVSGCVSPWSTSEDGTPTTGADIEVRLLGSDVDRVLFDQTAVRTVGPIKSHNGQFYVEMKLSEESAAHMRDIFHSAEVDDKPEAFEIVVVGREGEITRVGVSTGLANRIVSGDWGGQFRMTFKQRSKAKAVREALNCGTETLPSSCDPE